MPKHKKDATTFKLRIRDGGQKFEVTVPKVIIDRIKKKEKVSIKGTISHRYFEFEVIE